MNKNLIPYSDLPLLNANTINLENMVFFLESKEKKGPSITFSRTFNKKIIDEVKNHLSSEQYRALLRDSFGNKDKQQALKDVIHSYVSSKDFVSRFKNDLGDYSNEKLSNYLVENIAGLGVLKPLSEIKTVTDIKVLAWDNVWVDDIYKGRYKTDITFQNEEEYLELCNRFVFASGESWTNNRPAVDAIFPYMRVNIVGFDLAPKTSLAIRLISKELRLSEELMLESGYASMPMIQLLQATFKSCSHLISGDTGSGKSECLRYFTRYTNDDDVIIVIEDTPETYLDELYVNKPINMWRTRDAVDKDKRSFDYGYLVKQSLRQTPNILMPQEFRGDEAFDVLQAAETGHLVNTTLHSYSAKHSVRRFVDLCQRVQNHPDSYYGKRITEYFHIGIHLERIDNVRRITEIIEYISYENNDVKANVLFQYDKVKGEHIKVNDPTDKLMTLLADSNMSNLPLKIDRKEVIA